MPFITAISVSVSSGTTTSAPWRVSGSLPNTWRVASKAALQNRPISWLVMSFIAASARREPSISETHTSVASRRARAASTSAGSVCGRYHWRVVSTTRSRCSGMASHLSWNTALTTPSSTSCTE